MVADMVEVALSSYGVFLRWFGKSNSLIFGRALGGIWSSGIYFDVYFQYFLVGSVVGLIVSVGLILILLRTILSAPYSEYVVSYM